MGAGDFILTDLHRFVPAQDELCFSYTPLDQRYVHNANLLGAWLLARLAARLDASNLKEAALASACYTARHLRPEGWWPYGEGARMRGWIISTLDMFWLPCTQSQSFWEQTSLQIRCNVDMIPGKCNFSQRLALPGIIQRRRIRWMYIAQPRQFGHFWSFLPKTRIRSKMLTGLQNG